jgi:hypothetical protein
LVSQDGRHLHLFVTPCPASFAKNFNDTISREKQKTISCDLRISGMAVTNQSLQVLRALIYWRFSLPGKSLSIPAYDKPE